MTPTEILRDAEDMATHYPGDRLRLTGQEVLALVKFVRADVRSDWMAAARECLTENARKELFRLALAKKPEPKP